MLDIIAKTGIVILVIVGLVETCRVVILRILRPHRKQVMYMIVPLQGHNEEAEYILRCAAERVQWLGGTEEKMLICLDCGMDEETRSISDRLCRDYSFMSICSAEEMNGLLACAGLQSNL
jgi:hypothetical protein